MVKRKGVRIRYPIVDGISEKKQKQGRKDPATRGNWESERLSKRRGFEKGEGGVCCKVFLEKVTVSETGKRKKGSSWSWEEVRWDRKGNFHSSRNQGGEQN